MFISTIRKYWLYILYVQKVCNMKSWQLLVSYYHMSRIMTKLTKWHVRPAKIQLSLGIHPVWSESSLCARWVAKIPMLLHADSEYFDQTGRMPGLIWAFAGRTGHFVGFVMLRLLFKSFPGYEFSHDSIWTNQRDPREQHEKPTPGSCGSRELPQHPYGWRSTHRDCKSVQVEDQDQQLPTASQRM